MGRSFFACRNLSGCSRSETTGNPARRQWSCRERGVFQYIQQFQGYIWPGVVAAFVMPFVLPRVPGIAGVAALLTGPAAYAAFQFTERTKDRPGGWHEYHFLLQVLFAFIIVAGVMVVMTVISPLAKPKELPVRDEISLETEPVVKIAGALVILGVIAFFIIFW